jgi:hypothetical protein
VVVGLCLYLFKFGQKLTGMVRASSFLWRIISVRPSSGMTGIYSELVMEYSGVGNKEIGQAGDLSMLDFLGSSMVTPLILRQRH